MLTNERPHGLYTQNGANRRENAPPRRSDEKRTVTRPDRWNAPQSQTARHWRNIERAGLFAVD